MDEEDYDYPDCDIKLNQDLLDEIDGEETNY